MYHSNDYTQTELRVDEVAKKINHFCAALYEYFIKLRQNKRNLEERIKTKEEELAVLTKELKKFKDSLEEANNNQAETKAILLERYKLDIDALETEDQL